MYINPKLKNGNRVNECRECVRLRAREKYDRHYRSLAVESRRIVR
jgi:Zn-finger protein